MTPQRSEGTRDIDGVGAMLDRVESPAEPYAGGSSSAIAAAFAAALVTMTARISSDWDAAPGIAAQGRTLRHRLLELAADDADAFAEAFAALEPGARPGHTPLGIVLARAADVPLAIANAAADVAELAAVASTGVRPSVRPDVYAAAALAEAACCAAAHLVDVNLATVPGDERREAANAARRAAAAARSRAKPTDD